MRTFKENAFTQLVVEYLTDAEWLRMARSATSRRLCPCLGARSRQTVTTCRRKRIRLTSSTVTTFDDESCPPLTAKDIDAALKRSVRLVELGRKGEFGAFEESTEPYDMLTQIRDNAQRIQRLRSFSSPIASFQSEPGRAPRSKSRI